MILTVKTHSLFFDEKAGPKAGHRWKKQRGIPPVKFIFFSNGKYPVSKKVCEFDKFTSLVDLNREEFIRALVAELERMKGTVGVAVDDGLYVDCEALGKVLLKWKVEGLG